MVEYAATPRLMVAMSSHTAAASHNNTCCKEAGKQTEKEHCPKSSSKGCTTTTDGCTNCPMCYVVVLPAEAEHIQITKGSREYPIWSSSYTYLHHTSCWKPPNQA